MGFMDQCFMDQLQAPFPRMVSQDVSNVYAKISWDCFLNGRKNFTHPELNKSKSFLACFCVCQMQSFYFLLTRKWTFTIDDLAPSCCSNSFMQKKSSILIYFTLLLFVYLSLPLVSLNFETLYCLWWLLHTV